MDLAVELLRDGQAAIPKVSGLLIKEAARIAAQDKGKDAYLWAKLNEIQFQELVRTRLLMTAQ